MDAVFNQIHQARQGELIDRGMLKQLPAMLKECDLSIKPKVGVDGKQEAGTDREYVSYNMYDQVARPLFWPSTSVCLFAEFREAYY